jgi:hypothetical protein
MAHANIIYRFINILTRKMTKKSSMAYHYYKKKKKPWSKDQNDLRSYSLNPEIKGKQHNFNIQK